jgi:uncharacterized protein (DUF4213/DUF364 family)
MSAADPWAVYDLLIESAPPEAAVVGLAFRPHWVLAEVDLPGGAGLAHVLPSPNPWKLPDERELVGRPAREAAALVKSWDFGEAAADLAVINACLAAARSAALAEEGPSFGNCFDVFMSRAKGRRVGVIGRFPRLEAIAEAASEMLVFERSPSGGDYPDPAAEYLLPSAEVVFMTGTAVINKTFPRLLELSRRAEVHLVGPSVPLCLRLLSLGVASLSGVLIPDFGALARELGLSSLGAAGFDRKLARRVNYPAAPA